MRVLHQENNIKDTPSGKKKCFGCFSLISSRRPIPNRAPTGKTPIVIPNNGVEEEFEATLQTYACRQKDGSKYSRHFLVAVSENGPAGFMRIENYDELLILNNDDFVQNLSHGEVLAIFHNVKVDGQSRFCLVVRRKPRHRWIWIETSAVLAPGSQTVRDDTPRIEDTEYKKLENNRTEMTTINRYKVRGTQLYLEIQNQEVKADVFTGTEKDNTKKICKRLQYWQDGQGQVFFVAALCDENRKNYIGVGPDNKIIVKNEPEWFQMQEIESDILFKLKDLYLGYNRENDQVDAQTAEFLFEEIPGDVELNIFESRSPSSSSVSHGPVLAHNENTLKANKQSKRSSVSSSESERSSSSNDSVPSDDEMLSQENSSPELGNCSVTANMINDHAMKTPAKCLFNSLNDSASSGYLSIHSERTEYCVVGSFDELDKGKIHHLTKETTV